MKKRKTFGFVIMLIGLAIVAYPLKLRLDSNLEQKRLKDEFNKTKNTVTIEKEDEIYNEEVEVEVEVKDIVYDSWPDTLITIPSIDVEAMVVEMEASDIDVFAANANYPPAHYRDTDLPGGKSNVAIAAHRTGPADYFRNLDKLKKGDSISLETSQGLHEYIVERVFIVDPTDISVIKDTDYGALTLTSCEREDGISNKKRIIVRARLKDAIAKGGE